MLHQRPRTGVQQHTSTAAKAHWHSIVSYRARSHAAAKASAQSSNDGPCDVSDPSCELTDPEAKFRRYGKHFGGGYKLTADWLKDVPRVRVRTSTARQQDELLELAVLNERLAGKIEPWQARQRLEYLKMRRKNWEQVYNYVTRTDAAATLSMIEEASQKVEELLSEESRENKSVTELKDQLVALQDEVDGARQRLHLTQARVEQNLQRVNELKAEAAALERIRARSVPTAVTAAAPVVASPRAPATVGGGSSSTSTSTSTSSWRNQELSRAHRRGLQSSLEMEDALRNFWYPTEFSSKLTKDTLVPFEILGEPWVLFRDASGAASCIKDECAHRACPLSLGKVIDGKVSCAYHGWEFDSDGACTKMPSTKHCRGVGVAALPTVEKDGFVWVWPGDAAPTQVPDFSKPPEGYQVHAEVMVEVPVEHGLLMENLLDLAHAPFTHTSTFAKGWSVPDAVKFQATKMLSGYWDPYPINMAFHPPCMVVSQIGLQQPGKIERGASADTCSKHLHQLHVCIPSRKGHTRLLYRMSLDFMPWVRYVPFIDKLWKSVAAQVLGEDLVLVLGQQDRMARGGDTWANPVSYDKLAVRYRRWRNSVAQGAAAGAAAGDVAMSSGEMFSLDEGDVAVDLGVDVAAN